MTMQATTAMTESTRAMVSGRCDVHSMVTTVGWSAGGIHQPLKPPSTIVGGPRSSPSAVRADQESWKPSPSTSQQPSGSRPR